MPNVAFALTTTFNPTGFNSTMSNMTVTDPEDMTTVSSYSYAVLSVTKNSTGYADIEFDCSTIPTNATVTSVTCKLKGRVNNTSRVTAATAQFYVGGTTSGSAVSIRNTSATTVTLLNNVTTLTRANLQNVKIRIDARAANTYNAKEVYVYGADLTVTYTVPVAPAAPTITPAGGEFAVSQSVTISAEDGANVRYTIDGTEPTSTSGRTYTGAFNLANTATVKAIAYNDNGSSSVTTATFTKIFPPAVTGSNQTLAFDQTANPFKRYSDTSHQYTGTITYESDAPGVASVDATGKVTGLAEGIAYITATPAANPNFTCTAVVIKVQVSGSHIPSKYSTSWSAGTEVYLYNKASGLYLGTGGHWGTEGYLKTTGVPVLLMGAGSTSGSSSMKLQQANGNCWGYVTGITSGMTTQKEKVGLYCDASVSYSGYKDNNTFKFTYNSDDGSFCLISDIQTSYASSKTSYMAQTADGTARANIVTARTYDDGVTIPDEARWFVVTKQNLIDEFDEATASNAQPKEATFFLGNSDFSREVTTSWEGVSGDSWSANYIRIGNSLFATGSPSGDVKYVTTYIEDEEKAIGSGTSYGGNGDNYKLTSDDLPYFGDGGSVDYSTYYNVPYGGYYNCRILGTEGTIKQSFDVARTGWYRVSLDGFIYNPSGATGKAILYAGKQGVTEVGKNYATAELPANNEYMTMTEAGIMFDTSTKYRTPYLLVYMNAGEKFEVGVTLSGGTRANARLASGCTFAEIDAVRLQFTGEAETILLNEEDLGKKEYTIDGKSVDYMAAQATSGARTLLLKRQIYANCWNSLVLPINISAASLKTAFGENVRLCVYDHTDGHMIVFKDVDLSNGGAVAMKRGDFYIVKPTAIAPRTSGTFTETLQDGVKTYSMTATEAVPVFSFSQVEMADIAECGNGFSEDIHPAEGEFSDVMMSMFGTYVKKEGELQSGSYAIASGGNSSNEINAKYAGNWVHYVGDESLDVLGFRCWIGPSGKEVPSTSTEGAKLTFMIDGVEEDATEIKGITVNTNVVKNNNNVYTVNGQMVRSNATDLNSLPKGIYIVNGKKYVVK